MQILDGLLAPTKVIDLAELQDRVKSHNLNVKIRIMIVELRALESFGGDRSL